MKSKSQVKRVAAQNPRQLEALALWALGAREALKVARDRWNDPCYYDAVNSLAREALERFPKD